MIWRIAFAAWITLLLAVVGQQSHAQFNGCSAGFCSRVAPGGGAASCASGLTGVILDLDASVSASVHQVAGIVSQWDDQSVGGNNVVQATALNRPTYSVTGFNSSKPGITTLASAAQFLQNTSFPLNTTAMSIFIVATITGSNPNNPGVVSFQAAGQSDDFGNNPSFTLGINNGTPLWTMSSNTYIDLQQTATVNTPQTIGWVFDGADGTGYLNFSADTPTARTAAFGGTTGLMAFGTRPWNGNTPSFDGTYAEIILATSVASSGQRGTLHTCLTAKWGVP